MVHLGTWRFLQRWQGNSFGMIWHIKLPLH